MVNGKVDDWDVNKNSMLKVQSLCLLFSVRAKFYWLRIFYNVIFVELSCYCSFIKTLARHAVINTQMVSVLFVKLMLQLNVATILSLESISQFSLYFA